MFANLERQYFAGVYSQLKMMSHSKHGRFNLHNTPFHQQLKEVDSSANRIALHKYNGTTLYEHPLTTDSLLCPWGKKALTFSLNLTHLILSFNTDTPSELVLTEIDYNFSCDYE